MAENEVIKWTDWIQAVSAAVSAVVSAILIYSLYLSNKQIKESNNWNKSNNAFNYSILSNLVVQDKTLIDTLQKVDFNFINNSVPLTDEQLKGLWEDDNNFKAVQDYLNLLENLAFGISAGAFDDKISFSLYAPRLIRVVTIFQPFIDKYRTESQNPTFYDKLTNLYGIWRPQISKRS